MSGASKILTVSYGTFSCTLEGFDDPFTTMRHIAEYFRDLAAEDRYFGCEPPVPDAETLQQIAQRSISKRVAAEMQGGGLILRQSADDVGEDMPKAAAARNGSARDESAREDSHKAPVSYLPAGMPSASEKLDRIRRAADVAPDSGDDASITALFDNVEDAESPTEVTGEEDVLPAFSEESAPELTAAETEGPAADLPEAEIVAAAEPAPQDAMPDEAVATEPADAFDEGNTVEAEASAEAETTSGARLAEPAHTHAEDETTQAEEEEQAATEVRSEAEADSAFGDPADAEDVAEVPGEAASTLGRARARLARFARRERPAGAVETATGTESPAPVEAADSPTAEAPPEETPAAESAPVAQTFAEPSPAEPEPADDGAADAADAIAKGSSLSSEEEAELEAELAALREDEPAAPAEEEAAEQDLAAALDISAPYGSTMDDEERPAAEISEHGERSELTAAEDAGAGPAESVETAVTGLEDVPAPASSAEDEPPAAQEAEAGPADSPFGPVDEAQEDQALSRLLETADSKLSGTETTRKRNAFQQLKAAVAATFADRQARRETPESTDGGEERSAAYRSDLRRATRPTRPAMPERSSRRPEAQPAPGTSRPAPLVLVSEQRIDERREAAPSDGGAIRPRRVLREADDLGESVRIAEQTPEEGDSFRDFAERIGANSLPELLEAAAAYTAHIEGRTRFSRAQVMSKIALLKAEDSDGFSREDGLRSFGKLLREGRIRRVQDGQFVINEESRFVQEARTGTH